jgi:hypothetical protein
MSEKQREAGGSRSVELPAAYCQGGFVQIRTIISPTSEHARVHSEEMSDPVPPEDPGLE